MYVRLQALGLLGGQRGDVERIGDRTARQVGRRLLGDLQRHLLLRLRRRGAEVRCGDDRVEPEQHVLLGRLDGEDVERRAGDMARLDGRLEVLFHHQRSEEHTSELQSLMRISYAVSCLKKKNKTTTKPKIQT